MTEFTDSQKKIIDASIGLIAEKSIQQLTIKNLAEKIGLTEGAIYRHFHSKMEILLSILFMFQNEAKENLERVKNSQLPALQQFEDIFLHRLKYFMEKPAVAAVIFSESIFQNHNSLALEVNKFLKMHEETLQIILERGKKNGEIKKDISTDEMIPIIIGSMRYLVTRWRLDGHNFDLYKKGFVLLESIKKLLACSFD